MLTDVLEGCRQGRRAEQVWGQKPICSDPDFHSTDPGIQIQSRASFIAGLSFHRDLSHLGVKQVPTLEALPWPLVIQPCSGTCVAPAEVMPALRPRELLPPAARASGSRVNASLLQLKNHSCIDR